MNLLAATAERFATNDMFVRSPREFLVVCTVQPAGLAASAKSYSLNQMDEKTKDVTHDRLKILCSFLPQMQPSDSLSVASFNLGPAMGSTCTWCWLRTFYLLGEPSDPHLIRLDFPSISTLMLGFAATN